MRKAADEDEDRAEKERLWEEVPRVTMRGSFETSRARAAALGAVKLMKHWPSRGELVLAVFACCIITVALFGLSLAPIILHHRPDHACRLLWKVQSDSKAVGNLYFVKHENRTWSVDELCNIELAARTYPEFNVYMINLGRERNIKKQWHSKLFDLSLENYVPTLRKRLKKSSDENNLEELMRYELSEVPNISNLDIGIDKFFSESILSAKKIGKLKRDKIELAAKFQAVWDSPGIAIEPLDVQQLISTRHLFKRKPDQLLAAVQMDNDLQASTVACQSFIGLVLREIAKTNAPIRQTVLTQALFHFCSGLKNCTGVEILETVTERRRSATYCPTIKFFTANSANVDSNGTMS